MQGVLYAIGAFGYSLIYTTMMAMHLYRYDPGSPNAYGWPILASSALVGVAALLGRVFNPFASVFIGYLSDKTQSRWGRRRPFMAIALLPMLVGFVLVFTPPVPYLSVWNAVYLTISLVIFLLGYATYLTPYLSLLAEIAQTTEQRLHLSMLNAGFGLVGFAFASIAAPLLVEHLGFEKMAIAFSAIAFVTLIAPLAIKENPHISKQNQLPFWLSLQSIKENSYFRPYIISQVCMWMAINIVFLCSNYLVVALLHREIGFGSVVNSAIFAGVLVGFVLTNFLAKRWGKKATLWCFLIGLSCTLLSLGIWSFSARDAVWICLVLIALSGASMSALLLIPNAILADIVDEDMKQTGIQRGAIYFGIQSVVITVSSGCASLLTGSILMLGKTPLQPLGVQLIYPIAGLFSLGAAMAITSYPVEK